MNYKYILFDLDGTVTDSKVGITKSVQYALDKNGIKEEVLSNLEKFIGPPLKDSFIEFYKFNEKTTIKAISDYREYFKDKGIFENEVYDGISNLLSELSKKEVIIAMATSKPTVYAERILSHFGLAKYFNIVIGSNLDGTRTSKTEVISYAIDKLKIKNLDEVVMIGDRKYDIIGAQKNNIESIGVLYGFGSIEELKTLEPTYIVNKVCDLYELLINN